MKKKFLFLIMTLTSLSVHTQAYAQKNQIEKMILEENKMLGDTTLLTFKGQNYIYNKKDKIVMSTKVIKPKDLGPRNGINYRGRDIKNHKQLDSIYNKTFSKERMMELKDSKLLIYCVLDDHGTVKELGFFMMKSPDITIEEINSVETGILNFKFELTSTTEEPQLHHYLFQCRFNELLNKRNSN